MPRPYDRLSSSVRFRWRRSWRALLRDEAGETRQRDDLLKDISRKNPFKPLADFFLASLGKGEKAEVDLGQAEKIIKSVNADDRRTCYYLLGRFLELRGQTKLAQEYYKRRLADEPALNSLIAVFAGSRLQELESK